jgi:hypothetical protein
MIGSATILPNIIIPLPERLSAITKGFVIWPGRTGRRKLQFFPAKKNYSKSFTGYGWIRNNITEHY